MTRNTKIVKKIAALFLVLLLSIDSFAAAVSDNDGSAFITKAEFDSLKNNFQSQIDQYNTNIDSKIDNAIANYLAGIKTDLQKQGENFIKSIKDVRFYSITKELNASTLANIRTQWLCRAFGALVSEVYSNNNFQNAAYGSWFYTTDGAHIRDGRFNTTGNTTNYFYQVSYIELNGVEYPVLDSLDSLSVSHTYGAYGAGRAGQKTIATDSPINFKPYNLDLRSMRNNNVEPWTFTWDVSGTSVSAAGSQFNLYNYKHNTSDKCFNYYYFSNNANNESKSVNTFTEDAFANWTVSDTFTYSTRSGGDWWIVVNVNNSTDINQWQNRRVYVGPGYGTEANNWITYEQYYTKAMGKVTYDTTPGKIYYYRPNFIAHTAGSFVNGDASKAIGKPVYPTDGVPLTKMIDKAKSMSIKLNIVAKKNDDDTVATGKSYYVIIQNSPFDNVSTQSLITSPAIDERSITKVDDGSSTTTITLDKEKLSHWNDDDILYLRAYVEGTDYYAEVDCEEILFTIEQ